MENPLKNRGQKEPFYPFAAPPLSEEDQENFFEKFENYIPFLFPPDWMGEESFEEEKNDPLP